MKYQPRKVFILENCSYQEITYQEHCRNQQSDESYQNRFFIPLQGMLLEVSNEVYTEFYREKERNRYLKKLDRENGLLSQVLPSAETLFFSAYDIENCGNKSSYKI